MPWSLGACVTKEPERYRSTTYPEAPAVYDAAANASNDPVASEASEQMFGDFEPGDTDEDRDQVEDCVLERLRHGSRRSTSQASSRSSRISPARARWRPLPSPFQGTFWDEEDYSQSPGPDDEGFNVPSNGVSSVTDWPSWSQRTGEGDMKGSIGSLRALSLESAPDVIDAPMSTLSLGFDSEADVQKEAKSASGVAGAVRDHGSLQKGENMTRGAEEDDEAHQILSDGGIGRRALSLHTKTQENRRDFFEVFRRTARQVGRVVYR